MNYRHAFHAGNFADVFKHAVLVRILVHLREKASAFRVIDTHAGAGIYDLSGPQASRTGEWRLGIGRLMAAPLSPELRALRAPYIDVVSALNSDTGLRLYPGSPVLALRLLRPQVRLIACELDPGAAAPLPRAAAPPTRDHCRPGKAQVNHRLGPPRPTPFSTIYSRIYLYLLNLKENGYGKEEDPNARRGRDRPR